MLPYDDNIILSYDWCRRLNVVRISCVVSSVVLFVVSSTDSKQNTTSNDSKIVSYFSIYWLYNTLAYLLLSCGSQSSRSARMCTCGSEYQVIFWSGTCLGISPASCVPHWHLCAAGLPFWHHAWCQHALVMSHASVMSCLTLMMSDDNADIIFSAYL